LLQVNVHCLPIFKGNANKSIRQLSFRGHYLFAVFDNLLMNTYTIYNITSWRTQAAKHVCGKCALQ